MTNTSSGWSPNGVPFVWLAKEALERIEQGLECGQAASAKLVYQALSRVASNEGTGAFSKPINYLANLASLERRTVEKRLMDLEKLGLVHIERRAIEGTKARDLNHYTLATLSRNLPNLNRKLANAPSLHAFAVNRELENSTPKPPKAEVVRVDEVFELFWTAYPRKVGKKAASKAFENNKCGGILDRILASVEEHKRSRDWAKDGGQFIPHPATFLNQHRWEDELPQQDAAQPVTAAASADETVWSQKL